LLIEFDHAVIRAPDDQERRRFDAIKDGACEIRPSAPGYDGADAPAELRSCDERSSGAGARAEQSERHATELPVLVEPANGVSQPAGEQECRTH